MKAFQFRLDQALHWRCTQRDIEKARVSVAAQKLQGIRNAIENHRTSIAKGAAQLSAGALTGSSFAHWASFTDRSRRQIKELEAKAAEAEKSLAAQTLVLVEANRKHQLLENLKENAQRQWSAEFNRELEAFAGESYLFRLQSRDGRARSSGG